MGSDSTRARVLKLRLSLLVALGIVPLSCGGSTLDGGGGGPGGTPRCSNSEVDAATQLTACKEGYFHRPVVTQCTPLGAASDAAPPTGLPRVEGARVQCDARSAPGAECGQFEYGYCRTVVPSPDCNGGCCYSGCVTDADCGPGYVCLCGSSRSPTGGECTAATCTTDADCGGFKCATHTDMCQVDLDHFACQTADDECSSDADCDGRPCIPGGFSGQGTQRQCFTGACGRPFLVEAQARLPEVVATRAWARSAGAEPRVDHLSESERASLAEHWTRLGQMEHASIAAFARFSLQLLALGAPPDLIEDCTRALADETAHAKLCFEIASAYAGGAIGPGQLDISRSLAITTLTDIVDMVILEGCVGETSAALEALDAAENAADPVIAAAYARIAQDEERHAALAFRFVRWALEREPRAVKQRILEVRRSAPIQHSSVRDVVVPCLDALLDLVRVSPAQVLFI